MRIIENDLEQNANFITGSFELVYITMNVKDLVENINIRLQLSQSEKENQIKTNLEIIMKSFTEEKQNKVKELYEAKDENLMYILESEMNDIKKAKTSILNLLGNIPEDYISNDYDKIFSELKEEINHSIKNFNIDFLYECFDRLKYVAM